MATIDRHIQYRRSIRLTLCVGGVIVLKALRLKMPRRVILWCAKVPGQFRIGGGAWRTIRLSAKEIKEFA